MTFTYKSIQYNFMVKTKQMTYDGKDRYYFDSCTRLPSGRYDYIVAAEHKLLLDRILFKIGQSLYKKRYDDTH